MTRRGYFITFEGGDGAGKTTLIAKLHHQLTQEGWPVISTRASGGTPLGEEIRTILLHGKEHLCGKAELFLFLADRAHHVKEVVRPALLEGKVVLCDRFDDSTVAYQGVARGVDPDQVRSLCHFATDGLRPDLTFFLDLDPREGLARVDGRQGKGDRIEAEDLTFHERIRSAFQAMAQKEPDRIRILDATLSASELLQQAKEQLDAIFFSCRQ